MRFGLGGTTVAAVVARVLCWEGCCNVRDLGGLATEDGGETAFGVIVRADSLEQLTAAGWSALQAYGVTLIVDLRGGEEIAPGFHEGRRVRVCHLPVFGSLPQAHDVLHR